MQGVCKGDTAGIQGGCNEAMEFAQRSCHGDAIGIKKGMQYGCKGLQQGDARVDTTGFTRMLRGMQYNCHRDTKGN